MKEYTVYVHISPNGKRYYGITMQEVNKRWLNGKGYRGNKHFTNAIQNTVGVILNTLSLQKDYLRTKLNG